MKLYPDMNWNLDTNLLTIASVVFYAIFIITFQAFVGIATIIAATTTALWNIYKFIMDRKDRKNKLKDIDVDNLNNQNKKS